MEETWIAAGFGLRDGARGVTLDAFIQAGGSWWIMTFCLSNSPNRDNEG
jgi:hypothetical protein